MDPRIEGGVKAQRTDKKWMLDVVDGGGTTDCIHHVAAVICGLALFSCNI